MNPFRLCSVFIAVFVFSVILVTSLALPLAKNIAQEDEDEVQLLEPVEEYQGTLRLVFAVTRHGERAPADTYPKDPNADNPMAPYGWGQLTNLGRQNQYNQGAYLRKRYDDFLGHNYSPDKFWLQSTDVDRTKMSAMLEAAGLWPPTPEQSFKPGLNWQPAALYYQPREEDTLLLIWDTCPRYAMLRDEIYDKPEVQAVQDFYQGFYKELALYTGAKIKNADDVASIQGTLTAEDTMGLPLPSWTRDYEKTLSRHTLFSLGLNVYDREMKRLRGGPMVKNMVERMLESRKGTLKPAKRKMFMYVGHDSTIVSLLSALDIWNNQMPVYNIMTLVELHSDEFGYNVQVFLKNHTDYDPYPMTIPGCKHICPLEEFIQLMKPVIPGNWDEECKVNGDYEPPPAPAP